MTKPQEWYIEQISGENNWRCLRLLSTQKGRLFFSKIIETPDPRSVCKGKIHLTFTPKEYYLYNDEFPQLKPELLDLQISKRFSDRGLIMDAGDFTHRARKIDYLNGWLNCLFLPRRELTELFSFVRTWKKIRSLHVVPAPAAVAALLKAVTDQAVLILLLDKKESQVLVVKDGTPIYNQSLTQLAPGVVDEALISHAVGFARVTVQKDHDIDDFHIARLGQARDTINLQVLGIDEWTPDFSQVFDLESKEQVLYYPRVYGAGYVSNAYNFLPKHYNTSWRLQLLSLRTSIFAAVAGAVLLAVWSFYLQPIIKDQHRIYQNLSHSVTEKQRELNNSLPPQERLDNFDRLSTIRTRASNDFRLDTLTAQLSLALSNKVRITDLTVRRQVEEEPGAPVQPPGPPPSDIVPGVEGPGLATAALTPPEFLQSKAFIIKITCTTKGSYSEATSRFEYVRLALSKLFKVEEMTWNYKEAEETGILKCNLFPKIREVTRP